MVTRQVYITTQGFTVWLTGLSGAGKSTIANALRDYLFASGLLNLAILDGDDLRKTLCQDLGFTREDRDANIRRIGFLGKTLTHYGVPNIVAVISPYRLIRQEVREMIHTFLEVYVSCPLEVCEQRDVKGLYAKARMGEIKMFTGIDDPYEHPENPEVTVYTEREALLESIQKIVDALLARNYLKKIPFEEELWQDTQEITQKLKNGLDQLNPPTSFGR
jgi:adenylylsulfate kinase